MDKTAIIYARVSSVGQAEEELPIESQLDVDRKKARELEAEVLAEFIDDGISGRNDDRQAFKDAIAFCKVNRVDYFICWSTSRFARNRVDAPWYKRQLSKCGTKMVYVSMHLDSSTKEGFMLEGILELFDDFQSRQIADDTLRSMIKNAREGYYNGGNVPFGYEVIEAGKRKRLAIAVNEALVVRTMFQDALAGAGAKTIAMKLNAEGWSRRGFPWSKATVGGILRNWVYCGYIVFNRFDRREKRARPPEEWIRTSSHAPIVDEKTFAEVQAGLNARAPEHATVAGSTKSTHFFTGMLRCGQCGRAMMIETATGRSATYSYYNCSGAIKGLGCPPRRVRARPLDEFIADFLVTRMMSKANLQGTADEIKKVTGDWAAEREQRRKALTSELVDVEARRRRLFDHLETGSDLKMDDLRPRLVELNFREHDIRATLRELEAEQPPPESDQWDPGFEQMQDFVREIVLESNSPQKVREFFGLFIERIVLLDDGIDVAYRKDRLVDASAQRFIVRKGWLPIQRLLRTGHLTGELPPEFRRAA